MNKKFKGELLNKLLQSRIPQNGEGPEWARGYDAAMMEMARWVQGYKAESTPKT